MFWFLSGPGHAVVSPETLNFFSILLLLSLFLLLLSFCKKKKNPISFVFYVHWQHFSSLSHHRITVIIYLN